MIIISIGIIFIIIQILALMCNAKFLNYFCSFNNFHGTTTVFNIFWCFKLQKIICVYQVTITQLLVYVKYLYYLINK
ncbi:hypothetical protein Hanom_Chr16g01511251 [Helianthus anomalus]